MSWETKNAEIKAWGRLLSALWAFGVTLWHTVGFLFKAEWFEATMMFVIGMWVTVWCLGLNRPL